MSHIHRSWPSKLPLPGGADPGADEHRPFGSTTKAGKRRTRAAHQLEDARVNRYPTHGQAGPVGETVSVPLAQTRLAVNVRAGLHPLGAAPTRRRRQAPSRLQGCASGQDRAVGAGRPTPSSKRLVGLAVNVRAHWLPRTGDAPVDAHAARCDAVGVFGIIRTDGDNRAVGPSARPAVTHHLPPHRQCSHPSAAEDPDAYSKTRTAARVDAVGAVAALRADGHDRAVGV